MHTLFDIKKGTPSRNFYALNAKYLESNSISF